MSETRFVKRLMPCARTILAVMVFWGQIQNYMMRINLSILIVAMVKDAPANSSDSVEQKNETSFEEFQTCPLTPTFSNITTSQKNGQEVASDVFFDWDAMTRGIILSSFSYGYITTQIIGGRLTEMYGVKRVYGFSQLATAILTLLSPVAAKLHVGSFIAVRILQGVFQGVTFPALQAMTARWVPLEERTSFIARSFFGTTFGLVITFPMCGALVVIAGWESAFYVIGALTFIWFGFWWLLVFDNPESHPRISKSELNLIRESLAGNVDVTKSHPVPWKSIFMSLPFIGVLATDSGNSWGLIGLASNGPTYLKYMLHVDIKTNGLVSGLPMLSRYLGGVAHSFIADWIQRRKLMSVVRSRRLFNSISQCMPAISMLMLVFAPSVYKCDVSYAVALLCIGMFFNGAISSGHFSSFVDLAPNFAGTLMGISNTLSAFWGFVVPLIIGAITSDNMTFSAWQLVFSLAASIYVLGNFVYVFLISGDPQPWNFPSDKEKNRTEEEQTLELRDTPEDN